jgi:hypothetical protein
MVQAAGDAAAQRRSRRKSLTMEADPEFSRAAPFINTSAASSSAAYTVSSPVAATGLRVSSSAAASAARQREEADSELYSLTPNSAAAHSHSTRVAAARNDRSGSVSSTTSGGHSARRPVELHSPPAASVADPPPSRPRVLHTVSRHRRPDDSSDGSTCSDMSEGENLRSPPRGSSAMTRTRGASAPAPLSSSGFDSKASIRSLLRDAAASGALGKGVASAGGPAVHLSLAKQLEQLAEEDSD